MASKDKVAAATRLKRNTKQLCSTAILSRRVSLRNGKSSFKKDYISEDGTKTDTKPQNNHTQQNGGVETSEKVEKNGNFSCLNNETNITPCFTLTNSNQISDTMPLKSSTPNEAENALLKLTVETAKTTKRPYNENVDISGLQDVKKLKFHPTENNPKTYPQKLDSSNTNYHSNANLSLNSILTSTGNDISQINNIESSLPISSTSANEDSALNGFTLGNHDNNIEEAASNQSNISNNLAQNHHEANGDKITTNNIEHITDTNAKINEASFTDLDSDEETTGNLQICLEENFSKNDSNDEGKNNLPNNTVDGCEERVDGASQKNVENTEPHAENEVEKKLSISILSTQQNNETCSSEKELTITSSSLSNVTSFVKTSETSNEIDKSIASPQLSVIPATNTVNNSFSPSSFSISNSTLSLSPVLTTTSTIDFQSLLTNKTPNSKSQLSPQLSNNLLLQLGVVKALQQQQQNNKSTLQLQQLQQQLHQLVSSLTNNYNNNIIIQPQSIIVSPQSPNSTNITANNNINKISNKNDISINSNVANLNNILNNTKNINVKLPSACISPLEKIITNNTNVNKINPLSPNIPKTNLLSQQVSATLQRLALTTQKIKLTNQPQNQQQITPQQLQAQQQPVTQQPIPQKQPSQPLQNQQQLQQQTPLQQTPQQPQQLLLNQLTQRIALAVSAAQQQQANKLSLNSNNLKLNQSNTLTKLLSSSLTPQQQQQQQKQLTNVKTTLPQQLVQQLQQQFNMACSLSGLAAVAQEQQKLPVTSEHQQQQQNKNLLLTTSTITTTSPTTQQNTMNSHLVLPISLSQQLKLLLSIQQSAKNSGVTITTSSNTAKQTAQPINALSLQQVLKQIHLLQQQQQQQVNSYNNINNILNY